MKKGWQTVPLAEVLKQDIDYVTELEPIMYPKLSVKLYGKGAVLDTPADGATIKMQRHQFAKPGQIILSEIWAKKGAIGIVPKEGNGALVTSHFFLFDVIETKIMREYIRLLLKKNYFAEALDAEARGTTGYASVRPKQFLSLQIPLPSLDEQRHIVERVEALTNRIAKAQSLREETIIEIEALSHSTLGNLLEEKQQNWTYDVIPAFAEVNPSRKGKVNLTDKDIASFVPMRAVDDITGAIVRAEPRPFIEISKGYTWFQNGDVIFARITPCMENGKSAIAKDLESGTGFGSTEFHVLRPKEKILAEWLYILVRSKQFRNDAAEHFKGTAGQQRVPQSFLENKVIPVPPLDEQKQIVAYLDSLQAKVNQLRQLQSESERELSALLPSILDKAFKGEL